MTLHISASSSTYKTDRKGKLGSVIGSSSMNRGALRASSRWSGAEFNSHAVFPGDWPPDEMAHWVGCPTPSRVRPGRVRLTSVCRASTLEPADTRVQSTSEAALRSPRLLQLLQCRVPLPAI